MPKPPKAPERISHPEVALYLFMSRDKQPRSVADLAQRIGYSQPSVKKHLKGFLKAGLAEVNMACIPAVWSWLSPQDSEARAYVANLDKAQAGYAALQANEG